MFSFLHALIDVGLFFNFNLTLICHFFESTCKFCMNEKYIVVISKVHYERSPIFF